MVVIVVLDESRIVRFFLDLRVWPMIIRLNMKEDRCSRLSARQLATNELLNLL